ncbi:hypothetical protein Q31a_34220 [Aureliella helgolandensis]|uniref:Uncharacterized protein n=1 Tax=Aureliella helgolandensis TaxID=2527968 RepID=A0A518G957_9BACT|nr:hypothetical protein Q31a_34220 [Aureliella helgolandensis]
MRLRVAPCTIFQHQILAPRAGLQRGMVNDQGIPVLIEPFLMLNICKEGDFSPMRMFIGEGVAKMVIAQ